MMAVQYGGAGGVEVVEYTRVPTPVLGDGDVLVEVAAAGMNRADIVQRKGHYPPPPGASPIPGLEVSGTVVAVGKNMPGDAPKIGEKVCALLAGGGYAQYVCVPASQVLPWPDGLDAGQAGAIMEVACTVVSNLTLTVRVEAGDWVLVHGGSGGIGTFTLQYLRLLGARAIATVSSNEKADWAKKYGAEHVINYREENFVHRVEQITKGRGVRAILDVVGGSYLDSNIRALADGGRLVIIGLTGGGRAEINLGLLLSKRAGVIATALRSRTTAEKGRIVREVQKRVWPLIETGELKVPVDRTFPLSHAAEAQKYFDSGEHRGKVVLHAAGD